MLKRPSWVYYVNYVQPGGYEIVTGRRDQESGKRTQISFLGVFYVLGTPQGCHHVDMNIMIDVSHFSTRITKAFRFSKNLAISDVIVMTNINTYVCDSVFVLCVACYALFRCLCLGDRLSCGSVTNGRTDCLTNEKHPIEQQALSGCCIFGIKRKKQVRTRKSINFCNPKKTYSS